MFERMTHATFTFPKPNQVFHPSHPLRNQKNHDRLLEYLQQRLLLGKNARDERLPRLGRIDRDVAGWILRTDETEVERERKKTQTGQPIAMDQNLPVTFIHIDDMMTMQEVIALMEKEILAEMFIGDTFSVSGKLS